MTDADRIMRRLNMKGLPENVTTATPITEMSDEVGEVPAFGWLRGVRDRANMLELRFLNGTFRSLAYAWLFDVAFDPSEGISLDFGQTKVKLHGRNLRPLHEMIQRHRVIWVQAQDVKREQGDENATMITGITVRDGAVKSP